VLLQLWDQHGAEVSSKICKIIGADGGFAQKAKNWPVEGMLTDVAYRWDVVRHCPALLSLHAASAGPAQAVAATMCCLNSCLSKQTVVMLMPVACLGAGVRLHGVRKLSPLPDQQT
jgi:hypothetical protein